MPFGDRVVDHLQGVGPESGGTGGDVLVAGDHPVVGHTVFLSGVTVGQAIQQHGVKAIAGGGKFGLGRRPGLELVPESAEFSILVGWEEAEDTVGGHGFAGMLVDHVFRVVGKGISRVDFDQIVDQYHFQHAQHVEGLVDRMFGQGDDHERKMPNARHRSPPADSG